MNSSIDFSGDWASLWSRVHIGITPGAQQLISWIALGIVLLALGRWVMAKHQGRQAGNILWALLIGAVIAAPNLILPAILEVIDQGWAIILAALPH